MLDLRKVGWIPILLSLLVAVFLILVGYNALTREYKYSYDSMNYIDIARNISTGKGITQNSLGFNSTSPLKPTDSIPAPATQQPPLYPIMLAGFHAIGIAEIQAAQVLSVILLIGIIFLTMWLLKEEGIITACLAAGTLLLFGPLRDITRHAWTEPLGIFFSLLCLVLLLKSKKRSRAWMLLFAGLFCGFSAASRYIFLFSLPFFCLILLFDTTSWKDRLSRVLLFGLGWALVVLPILIRNRILTGTFLPGFLPSNRSLAANLGDLINVSLFQWLDPIKQSSVAAIILVGLILIALIAWWIRRRNNIIEQMDRPRKYWILFAWGLCYLIILVIQRTRTHFDQIDLRLSSPGLIFLWIVIIGLLAKWLLFNKNVILITTLIILLAGTGLEIRTSIIEPQYDQLAGLMGSPRYRLAKKLSGRNNLIIGHDVIDVTFLLQQPTVSFSYYPATPMPTYPGMESWLKEHCDQYKSIYLLLKEDRNNESDPLLTNGQFIADLLVENPTSYPGFQLITPQPVVPETIVYQYSCKHP